MTPHRAEALGHYHQRGLLELVGGAELAHALQHDAVQGLVRRNPLRPQPGMLHAAQKSLIVATP